MRGRWRRTGLRKPIGTQISMSISGWERPSVPSLAPPAELLRALSRALAEIEVGWYVFGAQAVLFWGRPRFTEDIDVTVQLGAITTSPLVSRLKDAGFALRVDGLAWKRHFCDALFRWTLLRACPCP